MNHSTPADASAVSIARIEAAINVWRAAQSAVPESGEILVLDAESRCLADLYGLMFDNGWASPAGCCRRAGRTPLRRRA